MENVFICSPLRTAIGTFGGALKDISAVDLGTAVVKEIINKTAVDPNEVDDCIMGNVLGAGLGQNPSRQVAVNSGLKVETPAVTVNRMCGSGLQSIIHAAQAIRSGDCHCIIAGGIENMSQVPFYLKKARWGYRMSSPADELTDGMVYDGLWDIFNDYHMGVTAENLAEKYEISREEQDGFAYNSQTKAGEAIINNKFTDQVVPVFIPQKKSDPVKFEVDEHPRPSITSEQLNKLKPVFKKNGTVTAGNSSGINDGAAAMLLMSESKVRELGLNPVGQVKCYAVSGVDPSIMGIGPVPAMQSALDKAGLSIDETDLFELNEAFAAQSLAVLRDFPIPREKLNVNGGAIALGHPVGATGAVLLVKLLHELSSYENARYGMVSLCIGGGMGIAMVVEKV